MKKPDAGETTIKARLRRGALARRNALSDDQRSAWSVAIAEKAGAVIAELKPARVALYRPIGSECDTAALFELARSRGAEIALPAFLDRQKITFRRHDSDDGLVAGDFGTVVPPHHAPQIAPDVVVVPVVGFDRRGTRLGYGRGHYDRAITRLREAGQQPKLLGIAFSVQEVETIPAEAHDVHLDWIVTEKEILAFRAKKD